MNCNQANKILIKTVLESFSLFPSKQNSRTAIYFALDREEKTPSLSVDFIKNTAFDFGTGKIYDCISIVQMLKKCSVSEALQYLEKFNFSIDKKIVKIVTDEKKYVMLTIKNLEHVALLQYLKSRKVEDHIEFLKEIHYKVNDKKYFGIGFKNDSGGYEIRNKYSKICLGKKDITLIKNGSKSIKIFEGFFDYYSFLTLYKTNNNLGSDYLILNSVSMVHKIKNDLKIYDKIELYFDNDNAGNRCSEIILHAEPRAKDCRFLYAEFKDLNEFLVYKKTSKSIR